MIYLSAPAIGRLNNYSRVAAHLAMHAGHFGPLLVCGRTPYARLDQIEARVGQQITAEQVRAAVAGRPDRILTIEPSED
jgi:hypothetical protein